MFDEIVYCEARDLSTRLNLVDLDRTSSISLQP